MGEVLGPFWFPKVSKGRLETKKCRKLTSRPPPQGPSWETKFGLFVDFVGLFSCRFFDCRFGRPPGTILSGFEEVFRQFFYIFFVSFGTFKTCFTLGIFFIRHSVLKFFFQKIAF